MLWKELKPSYRRLMRQGTQGEAVIVDAKPKVSRAQGVGIWAYDVTIRVKFGDGTSSDLKRYVDKDELLGAMVPGAVVPIRFDPTDRSRVEIDTAAMLSEQARQVQAVRDAAVQQAEQRVKPVDSQPPEGAS